MPRLLAAFRVATAVACCLGPAAAARADPAARLAEGIQQYEAQDDVQAVSLLRALLREAPPPSLAAKAHIYLGLIALNELDGVEARTEFAKAIQADPTVDLPPGVSPKARIAFAQAQRRESAAPTSPSSPQATPQLQAAPTGEGGRNWWAPGVFAGLGVVALGLGIGFGVESSSQETQAGKAAAWSDAVNLAKQSQTWAITADVGYGVAAAAGVTAVILFFTGAPSSTPAVALLPTPGGGVVSLGASW